MVRATTVQSASPSGTPKRARRRTCSSRAITKARSRGDSSPDGIDHGAGRPAASGQLERDPAAEGVADQRWRVQAEAVQLGLDRISQSGRDSSGAIGKRQAFAEAGEIDRDHVVAALKGVEHWAARNAD